MDAFDPAFAPAGFGLNNTGAICYLNSFLQILAGCTAFTKAVLENEEYLSATATGRAVADFVRGYATGAGRKSAPDPDLAYQSARVLAALTADLRARKPNVHFGGGQESASEAFMHLLDMMEPPAGRGRPPAAASPVTRLFLHRMRCDVYCQTCQGVVSKMTDNSVSFNMFHVDALKNPPSTPEAFSKAIRLQVSKTEDYKCEECLRRGAAPADAAPSYRLYQLTMTPEIVICVFNLYVGYGGVRQTRYVPDRLEFPAVGGGAPIRYRMVGQVEHSGGLSGGHYWCRALRAGGRVCLLNDTSVVPVEGFAATPNTYMAVYHAVSSLEQES
jgi:ubiquitin C-terminal hydrolase